MTADGLYDPLTSKAFAAAFGMWALTLIDQGIQINPSDVDVFKVAFQAGFEHGEDDQSA